MTLELLEPLEIELTCNGNPQSHELTELTITIPQPAFGIAQEDTIWKAFPPGGLVLEAEGVVDTIPFHSRRPIEQPVYLRADDGWMMIQGIDGSWLEFDVPCNGELADVLVWWGFSAVAATEQPPSVQSIDIPSAVSCPDLVELESSCADPDGDIASIRWIVDGVLIDEDTTSIPFTTDHDLTVVVLDERGAANTMTKSVTCQ